MAITLGSLSGISLLESCSSPKMIANSPLFRTSFDQPTLPYAYSALEPYIDAKTMEIHFTKHAATYASNLKEAATAEGVKTSRPLEEVLAKISKYTPKMRNNAGGHYNHELFWKSMKTRGEGKPSGTLLADVETSFRSFSDFKSQFADAAKTRFGSGWAWLIVTSDKKLAITSTANQDNPLMDIAEVKGIPLLGLDVWEHAYYLKYQNKRADYIDSWWNVVDWDFVQKRYDAAKA
ncbi:MAG: superoxide dismutase [Chitinophagaceae bacterium]|nr:superoxide dismutase [Chitinophagaceae bacterium]